MKPIKKYVENFFANRRVLGSDPTLNVLPKTDMLLGNLVRQKKVPGLSITVLKDGKTLFEKGYGYSDIQSGTPVNFTKTKFRIASVSKPIAATALAYMVADGIIDLDASFYTYVPYYPKKKWDFTIRQLASHTAGIRCYKGMEYGLNHPYTIKESIRIFKDDDLIFEPGGGYLYYSFDWVLISLAMQEASGIPFDEIVRQKVLVPIGMKNTRAPSVTERDEHTTNLATFYTKNRLGFRTAIQVNNHYKLAGGGYLSTSADIAKLGQWYLEEAALPKEIRSQFLTSKIVKGKPTFYGLGWQVSEDSMGRKYFGHIGNGVGGYSNFFIYPDKQMVFAILINCTDPKVQSNLDEMIGWLLDDI
ncbi:hypothetical protein LCGC14_0946380 [marine sediment metagenome]|uniref:Class A beta-lactamase-related serine hydrolase n=2 Tax=root TaxID=1 RepID=A0A831QUY0_9FLAO|nr:class A beta-lactamase-related serine hydrolase [Pricia antarctica]